MQKFGNPRHIPETDGKGNIRGAFGMTMIQRIRENHPRPYPLLLYPCKYFRNWVSVTDEGMDGGEIFPWKGPYIFEIFNDMDLE